MKNKYIIIAGILASFAMGYYLNTIFAHMPENDKEKTKTEKQNNMKLGAFSISLCVKNLMTSKSFTKN